jgi:predicted metal-dependent phosphotriesterase family hydrolase
VEANESAVLMALDGRDGIDRGSVRAGVISVSINDPQLTNAFDAAAISGLPIVIDVEHLGLRDALKRLEHWKQPVERVILSGIDPAAESAQHAALEAGAILLFDGLSGDRARDAGQSNAIARLVQAGHGESLLLGYNPHSRAQWLSYGGGPGWPYLIEQFPLLLLDQGLSAVEVKTILVDNPNRAFVIERPAASDFFE